MNVVKEMRLPVQYKTWRIKKIVLFFAVLSQIRGLMCIQCYYFDLFSCLLSSISRLAIGNIATVNNVLLLRNAVLRSASAHWKNQKF